jgi:hypothetical protein
MRALQALAAGLILSAALLGLMPTGLVAATTAAGLDPAECDSRPQGYVLSTPQIVDPLCPLAHVRSASGQIAVRSAVATLADPLETHLGRAFDIQLSSLIRAFHTKDYVLDGFAFTWDPEQIGDARSGSRLGDGGTAVLLAADGRLSLERPAAVFLLIAGLPAAAIALWLRIQGRRHLVIVAPLRHMKPSSGLCEDGFHSIAPTETAGSSDTDSGIRRAARWLPVVLISVVSPIILLAAVRVYELFFSTRPGGTWELAHGRDGEALLCLFLLYLFAALIGGWRLYLWRSRCLSHFGMLLDVAPVSASESSAIGRDQIAISGFAVGVVGLLLMGWFRGVPTAVDSSWPALVVAFTLLLLGVWFLAELWSESRRLTWFAHLLAPTVGIPADGPGTGHDSSTKSAGDSWASPQRLHAFPQSPFNLHFRTRDLEAIHAYPDDAWRTDTRRSTSG